MQSEHRNFSKKLSTKLKYKKRSGGANKFAAAARAVQSSNRLAKQPASASKPGSSGFMSKIKNFVKRDPNGKPPATPGPTLRERASSFMGRFKKDPPVDGQESAVGQAQPTASPLMDIPSVAGPSAAAAPVMSAQESVGSVSDSQQAQAQSAASSEVRTPFVAPDLKSLSAAFQILYDVITLIAAILVVIYFILAFSDIIIYISRELKQKQFLIFDPNLFNKNTSEFEALKYNTNDQVNEPYNIYLEQTMIKQMFRVSGLFFVVVGLQIGSFLALKLLAILKNQEFTDTIDKPKNIGTIVIVLTSALVLNAFYKSKFLEKLQPDLRTTQSKINNMKDYIYNNLTTNVEFLEAMLTNDITTVLAIMNKQLTKYSLAKMVFTISLYNYYKSNISENDEIFEEVRKIFTIREIKLQQIDPIKYFYYKQNVFIPNMYVVMKDFLNKSPILTVKGRWNELEERSFRIMINARILDLNRNLLQLLKLSKKKTQLLFYLLVTLFISFIFLAMVAGMYKDNIMSAWVIIQPILLNIWNKITSLFRKKE